MRPKRARAASTAAGQSARAARASFTTSVSAPSARASRARASALPGRGLGEKEGVVAGHVLGVLARRTEYRPAPSRDVARERVHLRTALRPEGHLAEPDAILGERRASVARVGLLQPEAPAGTPPADDGP